MRKIGQPSFAGYTLTVCRAWCRMNNVQTRKGVLTIRCVHVICNVRNCLSESYKKCILLWSKDGPWAACSWARINKVESVEILWHMRFKQLYSISQYRTKYKHCSARTMTGLGLVVYLDWTPAPGSFDSTCYDVQVGTWSPCSTRKTSDHVHFFTL